LVSTALPKFCRDHIPGKVLWIFKHRSLITKCFQYTLCPQQKYGTSSNIDIRSFIHELSEEEHQYYRRNGYGHRRIVLPSERTFAQNRMSLLWCSWTGFRQVAKFTLVQKEKRGGEAQHLFKLIFYSYLLEIFI